MKFYVLSDNNESFVEIGRGNDWESITCPINTAHRRAGKRVTRLHLKIRSNKPVDFSWTLLNDIVISDNARRILENAGLTGFEIKPTAINHSKRKLFKENGYPLLWEFVTTGDGGYSHKESGIFLKNECKECNLIRYSAYENGIIVDEKKWDGSDFFTIKEYPKIILVTESAKSTLINNSITNVSFTLSSEKKWPESVIKP